jgi:hypothetical protein
VSIGLVERMGDQRSGVAMIGKEGKCIKHIPEYHIRFTILSQ